MKVRKSWIITQTLSFFVPGVPATQGSKIPGRTKTGHLFVRDDNPRTKEWKNRVALQCRDAIRRKWPREGLAAHWFSSAVHLELIFTFARPKSHFGTGKNAHLVKLSAPKDHLQTPDLTKLERAVEDAMKGIAYRDDAQVRSKHTRKTWVSHGDVGVQVEVRWTAEWFEKETTNE